METRPLGKTGEMMPILSLGCQRIVDEEGCSEEQAVAILNTAIDRGIRYFDTAWVYSAGQSEERVGLVAKHCGTRPPRAPGANSRPACAACRPTTSTSGGCTT
jgi:aryl-alcohol dehydrogenase-like predicted oxidoreductase